MQTEKETKYFRAVKSFVRRPGRMTMRQRVAIDQYWQDYGLDASVEMPCFKTIFGREAPLILEIGFGMGHSLQQLAQANPDYDFIGIEVHQPGVGALLAHIAESGLNNVRIYYADALEVLENCIADGILDGVLLFFPDPWPKKRHQKRRIVQSNFITLLKKKLKLQGYVHIATDVEDYAQHIISLFHLSSGFCGLNEYHDTLSKPCCRPNTKFEKRGQNLGNAIMDMIYIKTDG